VLTPFIDSDNITINVAERGETDERSPIIHKNESLYHNESLCQTLRRPWLATELRAELGRP